MPALTIPNVPVLGTKGAFKALAPFNTLLNDADIYTVKSIRSIDDYFSNGETPDTAIYSANSISSEEFFFDHKNEIPIVGLETEGGNWVFIPARYLSEYPRIDGVKYVGRSLVVSLPPMPVSTDLTTLTDSIKEISNNFVGVTNVDVSIVETSKPVSVAHSVHLQTTDARNTSSRASNFYVLYQQQLQINSELLTRIGMLEQTIVALQ